jgi:hypothetical protein
MFIATKYEYIIVGLGKDIGMVGMFKAKNEGGDEHLVFGDRHGVAKAAEKMGNGGQPQQARREGKERIKTKDDVWDELH